MKNKIFNTFLLLFLLTFIKDTSHSFCYGNETELYILGTVHESTHAFNSDTLLKILNEIGPDVILVECDSSYMTKDFQLKDEFKNAFLETSAVTEYLKLRTSVLRPYDISGRDGFLNDNNRISDESDFFREIILLNEKQKYSKEAAEIYSGIVSMISSAEKMSLEKASYINSPSGSSETDTINYYTYVGIRQLIDITPALEKYKSYWEKECNYWEDRNKAMLNNILESVDFYEGKKIVVLCGFAHKNILINGIMKSQNKKIMLKNFWNN